MIRSIDSLLNLAQLDARALFNHCQYPWEALTKLKAFLLEYAKQLPSDYEEIIEHVWVAKGTIIESSALIKGPAIIGYDCEIRHAAYIRENVLIGNQAVIGNSTELKNAILFNNAQAPHFNYVGDSILGYKAHTGAGVILSNLKSNGSQVTVQYNNQTIPTGMRKLGAILGAQVEIGCNSVLNPGTIVGKNSIVYPLSFVRGYVPENSIFKNSGEIVKQVREDL